jgi:hypothetical protein
LIRGDLIAGNLMSGFPTSIQVVAAAAYNVFRGNTLICTTSAFESPNPTNLDIDNTKVMLQ